MKGIYGLKFFYLAEDEKSFLTQWYANGKMFWYAVMMMEKSIPTIVLLVRWNMIKPKNGSNVMNCVSSGSTNNVFTIKFHFSQLTIFEGSLFNVKTALFIKKS